MVRKIRKRMLDARKRKMLMVLACIVMLHIPAYAQQTEEMPGNAAEEVFSFDGVVVSAKRYSDTYIPPEYAGGQVASGTQVGILGNQDYMSTPFSIVGFTAKTIENQQGRSLAGVISNDPAVRSNAYSSSNDTWTIRGLNVSSSDVGFNGLYGILSTTYTGTEFIERVEVLKGPSAMINGMPPLGGLGGTINLIPKRATDEPITKFTASYAGAGQFGGHLDIGRRFGEENKAGIRVNASRKQGDTRFDNETVNEGNIAVGLDIKGEKYRASMDFGYAHGRHKAPTSQLFLSSGLSIPKLPENTTNFSPKWARIESENSFIVFNGEYDLSPAWTVFGAAGYRENSFDDYLFGDNRLINSNGDYTQEIYDWPLSYNSHVEEFGVRGVFTTGKVKQQLVLSGNRLHINRNEAGIDLFTTSNIYARTDASMPGRTNLQLKKGIVTDLSSVVLTDTISTLDDKVQFILGVRHQNVEINTVKKNSRLNDSATSPAFGIVYKTSPKVSLYGNYMEGLQPGKIANNGINKGESLPAFKAKQQEIGLKFDAGNLGGTLSLFQIEQPMSYLDPDTNIFGTFGDQRNRGIELSLFGEPRKGFRLLGGVMYMDADLQNTAKGVDDGNMPIGLPRWNMTLGAEQDIGAVPGLTLTARAVYNGDQYLDAANRQRVPSWTRFDVGARYRLEHTSTPMTIRASVQNVFNKKHWVGTTGGGLVIGEPRTFLLSATFDL